MPTNQLINIDDVLGLQSTSYRLVLVAADDHGNFLIDLSDRVNGERLVSMGGIQGKLERGLGTFDVTLSSLVLDNSDGYWSGPPPTGLSSWYRTPVFLGLSSVRGGGLDPDTSDAAVGVWLIDDLEIASDSPNATMKLVSLSKRLVDKLADRVRAGKSWHTNKTIGWLVQQLLLTEHTKAEVKAWVNYGLIATRYKIPLADPTQRAVGSYGRPPEFDANASVWLDVNDPEYQASTSQPAFNLYGNPLLVINDTRSAAYGQVFIGIDFQLWRWDPDADAYTMVAQLPAGEGKSITNLFYNYNGGTERVIAVAHQVERPSASAGGRPNMTGAGAAGTAFFRVSPTASLSVMTKYAMPGGLSPGDIWTGYFAMRGGGYNASPNNAGGVGAHLNITADNARFGINCPMPAGHYIRFKTGSVYSTSAGSSLRHTLWDSHSPDLDQSFNVIQNADDDASRWGQELSGYMGYGEKAGQGDGRPYNVRHSFGQRRGAFAHEHAGNRLAFLRVVYDLTLHDYRFEFGYLNTSTGVYTMTGIRIDGIASFGQPYCLEFWPDDSHLTVGGMWWQEQPWSGGHPVTDDAYHFWYEIAWPALNAIRYYGNNANYIVGDYRHNICPMEFLYGGSSRWVAAVYFQLDQATGSPWLFVVHDMNHWTDPMPNDGMKGTWGTVYRSAGRLSGIVYDPVRDRFFFHEAGTNQLLSVPANSNNTAPSPEDSGFPPVPFDPSLTAGLVYDAKRDALYGISGPGAASQHNPETMSGPQTGKYALWQYASFLPDRIELADFSDMSVWDALGALAAAGDFLYGYDSQARFSFRPRTDYTEVGIGAFEQTVKARGLIADSFDDLAAARIVRNMGYSEVFNVAEIKPSAAMLQEPSATIRLLTRPAQWSRDPWDGDPQVFQNNDAAQNIFLRAVVAGQPGDEDAGCVHATRLNYELVDYAPSSTQKLHRLRFAFLLYDRMTETQTTQLTTIGSRVVNVLYQGARDAQGNALPPTPTDLEFGDVVEVAGEFLSSIESKSATGTATGVTALTLRDAFTKAYPPGTKVTIRSLEAGRWSDHKDGVALLYAAVAGGAAQGALETWQVNRSRDIAVGMVLRLEGVNGVEEVRVSAVLGRTAPANVYEEIKVVRGINGTTPVAFAQWQPLKGYWAPIENAAWPAGTIFYVGGTGVGIKLNLPPPTAGSPPTVNEKPFMVGDEIQIECPGLELVEQQIATAVSFNQASIDKYGRIPWPQARNTKFLSFRQAVETVKRITNDYGAPHFLFRADLPFVRRPVLGDPFWVRDETGVLPIPRLTSGAVSPTASPNGQDPPLTPDTHRAVATVMRGFTLNPLTDTMTLELRAVRPHIW